MSLHSKGHRDCDLNIPPRELLKDALPTELRQILCYMKTTVGELDQDGHPDLSHKSGQDRPSRSIPKFGTGRDRPFRSITNFGTGRDRPSRSFKIFKVSWEKSRFTGCSPTFPNFTQLFPTLPDFTQFFYRKMPGKIEENSG